MQGNILKDLVGQIPVLGTILQNVLTTINGKTSVDVDMKKLEIELQKVIIEGGSAELQQYVAIAIEQAKINQILATNGNLGWRDWLCKGLTVALLSQVGAKLLVGLIGFTTLMFHGDITAVKAAGDFFLGYVDIADAKDLLIGLAGLYVYRGYEKRQLINTTNNFSVKRFFDVLRSQLGRPLEQKEVDIFNRAIQAAMK